MTITPTSPFLPALAQLAANQAESRPVVAQPVDPQPQASGMSAPFHLDSVYFSGSFASAVASMPATASASMAELVGGTEPLPIDTVLALIAGDVYLDESAGPGELAGWTRLGPDDIPDGVVPPNGWVDGNGIIHGPGGVQAAIYVNEYGDYVVAFRGTEPGSAADWMTNLDRSGLRQMTAQDGFAMDLAVNMEEAFPGRVIFTGHSLGGGLAVTASLATGAPAVVFNPAGTNNRVIEAATARRNGSQGTEHSSGNLVDEANAGNVRVYQNEGDWVTLSQENSGAANMPATIGHRVRIEDQRGLPPVLGSSSSTSLPEAIILDAVLGKIPLLGAGGHHDIDNTAAGVFTSTYAVAQVDGNVVTMTTPSGNRGLPPGDIVIESITFATTDEGREAQRTFLLTGKLPEDMAGVESMTVTHNADGGTSISQTTHFEDGMPAATEQIIYRDGEAVLRIDLAHDAEGGVIDEATTYTFQATPQTTDEARELSMVLFGTPDGPIEVGETYTVTLDEAQMTEAAGTDATWPARATEPGNGVIAGMPENGRFAVDLAANPAGWVAGMARLQTLSGTLEAPVEGVVTSGNDLEPPETPD